MNKTTSINIGGFFFHIDEEAFQKLSRYLDAVKRSLDPEGREEIMNDIESRIAELFQERIKSENQVIKITDLDEIITIMGQPEDYKIDEEDNSSHQSFSSNTSKRKNLYRDRDNAILGGVSSGFGHYVGIDPLWIRIIFIVLTFPTGGATIPVYLLMWILIPEAITTSQKLEMRGEAINISNIEKKVKEGINDISEKINKIDQQKVANSAKNGANQIANTVADIFLMLFKAIAKVVGVFIIIFSAMALLGVLIGGIVMIFSSTMPESYIFNYVHTPFEITVPLWIQGLLLITSIGIPLFFMLLLGFKLLLTNMKSIGNYFKITLVAVWLVAIISLIYIGVKQVSEKSFEGKTEYKQEIQIVPNDTLFVKMAFNDYFSKNVKRKVSFKHTHDENNNEVIYSNDVKLHLMKTDKELPYIQIEKKANGKSHSEAKNYAEKITYNFDIQENNIILDNYFITDYKNKNKDQEVNIYLYLPKGTYFYPDNSISKYLTNWNSDISIYYGEENNLYLLDEEKLNCISCISNDTIKDSINENLIIKVNDKELNIGVKENEVNIQTK